MTEKIMERAILTCAVKETDTDRVLVFDGSTEGIDRMDESISAQGWELANYKKNPVFLWAHDYSMPPIGRSVRTWVDKEVNRLKFKIEFADAETYPFADTIYRLFKGGFMNAVSVGFIPIDWEDRDDDKDKKGKKAKQPRRRYIRQELLELSAAPVPANPEALQNAVTAGVITSKEKGLWDSEGLTFVPTVIDKLEAETERLLQAASELDTIRVGEGAIITTTAPMLDGTGVEDNGVGDSTTDDLTVPDLQLDKAEETYNCECIDCGFKLKSDKHCKDIKCPECGGDMRREERPAGGRAAETVTIRGLWNSHQRAVISQEELMDEIESLTTQLDAAGISDYASITSWELVRTLLRLTGGDMPDDIATTLAAPPEPLSAIDIGKDATATIIEAVRDGLRTALSIPK